MNDYNTIGIGMKTRGMYEFYYKHLSTRHQHPKYKGLKDGRASFRSKDGKDLFLTRGVTVSLKKYSGGYGHYIEFLYQGTPIVTVTKDWIKFNTSYWWTRNTKRKMNDIINNFGMEIVHLPNNKAKFYGFDPDEVEMGEFASGRNWFFRWKEKNDKEGVKIHMKRFNGYHVLAVNFDGEEC